MNIVILSKLKDRELYKRCQSIDHMLAVLGEEITELEQLEELGVRVKPTTGILKLMATAELNSKEYIDLKSKGFDAELPEKKIEQPEVF